MAIGKSIEERKAALKKAKARKAVIGVGMMRGSDAQAQDENPLEGEMAQGRKRRRQIGRSASKTSMKRSLGHLKCNQKSHNTPLNKFNQTHTPYFLKANDKAEACPTLQVLPDVQ